MSVLSIPTAEVEELSDLLERLGNLPIERIRVRRPLGNATEEELLAYMARSGRNCELVDGVIVEKAMGYYESLLAATLIGFLDPFRREHKLGILLGADGMMRVEGQVRLPDVSFFAWSRFPNRLLPRVQILGMAPDFAVEVLSPRNTRTEMERKRREYFAGGTKLVWEVFPDTQIVYVYTDADTFTSMGENDTLEGGTVLPGFTLSIKKWFESAGSREEA